MNNKSDKKLNKKVIYIIGIAVLVVSIFLCLFMCGKDDKGPTNGDVDNKVEINTDKDTVDEEDYESSDDGLQVEESGSGVEVDFSGDEDDSLDGDSKVKDEKDNDSKEEQKGVQSGEGTSGLETEEGTKSETDEEAWGPLM